MWTFIDDVYYCHKSVIHVVYSLVSVLNNIVHSAPYSKPVTVDTVNIAIIPTNKCT